MTIYQTTGQVQTDSGQKKMSLFNEKHNGPFGHHSLYDY